MYKLEVENERGQRFTLTQDESRYQIIKVDGLNPPNASIISTKVAGMDGSRFASSKLEERNIVLTIAIKGAIEENRIALYNYFKTKRYCKIYYTNEHRKVYCEGYVETMETTLFEQTQTMQISIICHNPYLTDIDEIAKSLSEIVGLFAFPFSINVDEPIPISSIEHGRVVNIINNGEANTGFIIEIRALGDVTNPIIYNSETNQSFAVDCSLEAGDSLIINSATGEKSVTLIHDGDEYNYLRYINRNSRWLTLDIGDNEFAYSCDTGVDMVEILIRFRTKYEGV